MIVVNNIIITKDYLRNSFADCFKKRTITDEDIDSNQYRKEIRYMTDKAIIDNNLILSLHSEKKYVVLLVDYIIRNLVWGHNYISLVPDNIIKEAHGSISKGDVSKAIKRCIELNIIVRTKDDIPEYKDFNKYIYTVNHNYIFKGNTKNYLKDTK